MNYETKESLLDRLADICLEENDIYHGYTDRDLINATLIFTHYFMDAVYTENQHLPFEKQMEVVETAGKAIRELIKVSCNKDMHELVKKI